MKIKYLFISIVGILIIISISQIFSIPPYSKDIFPIYKSGYFKELDRGFNVIIDSFINIKMMSKPVYAWIFLKDIEKKHKIKIHVYNNNGIEVPAPGETKINSDETINKILNSMNPQNFSAVKKDKYYSAILITLEDRCRFCHTDEYKKNIVGLMTFERNFDSLIYYTSERVIIFVIITLVLLILLYYIIRWEPGKSVKELFDK